MVMAVDIEGVGQDMYSIPITAECEVPSVEIKPSEKLDFEHVYLRDSTTKTIQLINNSNLQAKYSILPQTEESKVLAIYEVDKESGTIMENATESITV